MDIIVVMAELRVVIGVGLVVATFLDAIVMVDAEKEGKHCHYRLIICTINGAGSVRVIVGITYHMYLSTIGVKSENLGIIVLDLKNALNYKSYLCASFEQG